MQRRPLGLVGWVLLGLLTTASSTSAADLGPVSVNLSGDLRLRSEYLDNAGFQDGNERWRQRFRLRLGLVADVTEHTTVGLRFASGAKSYPTSGNQTLDSENLAKFDFPIDRVFVRYQREAGPAVTTFYVGKFGHPFYTPTEIVWDGDLQPAGAAEVIEFKPMGITLALGQYVIRESEQTTGKGSSVYVEQFSWRGQSEPAAFGLGVAYYAVSNPVQVASDAKANNSDFLTNKNFGTCTVTNPGSCTGALSDFQMLNASAEVTLKQLPLPLKLVGEYVNNLGAKEAVVGGNSFGEENMAWLAAVYYGTAGQQGDWRIGAGYAQIEADATVASFNSDDLQQTNVNTIFTELRYQLASKISVYYDGYYQQRNNIDLARANVNAAVDDTTLYRHRVSLVAEF